MKSGLEKGLFMELGKISKMNCSWNLDQAKDMFMKGSVFMKSGSEKLVELHVVIVSERDGLFMLLIELEILMRRVEWQWWMCSVNARNNFIST